jgi:hypothetical protein
MNIYPIYISRYIGIYPWVYIPFWYFIFFLKTNYSRRIFDSKELVSDGCVIVSMVEGVGLSIGHEGHPPMTGP